LAFRFSVFVLSGASRLRPFVAGLSFGALLVAPFLFASGSLLPSALLVAGCLALWLAVRALALFALAVRALSCAFVARGLCPSFGVSSRRAVWARCFRAAGGSSSVAFRLWAGGAASWASPSWRRVSPAVFAAACRFRGCWVLASRPAAVSRVSGRVLSVWVLSVGSFPSAVADVTDVGNKPSVTSAYATATAESRLACSLGVKKAARLSARRNNPTTPLLTIPP